MSIKSCHRSWTLYLDYKVFARNFATSQNQGFQHDGDANYQS